MCVRNGSEAHVAFYSMGTGEFRGGKMFGECSYLHPCSAEIR